MARLIRELKGPLTNEQIAAVYALAEECEVGICLWQNTPSPSIGPSTWGIEGNILRIRRFLRNLNRML